MRIALAAHSASPLGGVESYLAAIIPGLRVAGHDIKCWFETEYADRGSFVDSAAGIPISIANDQPALAFEALERWKPDVVYAHGFRSPEVERRLLHLAPAVFFAHSYYGTCVSGAKMHAAPSETPCTRRFGPACLGLFYPRRCGGWNPITMLKQYGVQAARLELLASYRYILVASDHMAAEYARHGLAAKTRVMPLPTMNLGAPIARVPDPSVWRLLYLGRLEWTKGADLALQTAATASDVVDRPVILTVAGVGPLAERLQDRARGLMRRHPRLRVNFAGWLDSDGRAAILNASDLLLMPSRWPEPFGLVGLEAGLHGVPCVAYDAGGIRQWLQHGANGWLVEQGRHSAARFTAAIVNALAHPAALEEQGRGAALAARHASLDRHVVGLEAVLSAAASRAAG